jgi:hypothetical protein
MLKVKFNLKGVGPIFFGKHVAEPKRDNETHEQLERRTWPQKIHLDENGEIILPGLAFKNALDSAGSWLGTKIPGKGNATYAKRFRCGVVIDSDLKILNGAGQSATPEDIEEIEMFVPSDGKRGGGKRVSKIFPRLPEWSANGVCYVMDEAITEDVFCSHLKAAGQFIGFGSMRVENGGTTGRFKFTPADLEFTEEEL